MSVQNPKTVRVSLRQKQKYRTIEVVQKVFLPLTAKYYLCTNHNGLVGFNII